MKKKNYVKRGAVLSMALVTAFGVSACGKVGAKVEEQERNKLYAIQVSAFDGGFGVDWVKTLAKEFNETVLGDTDYEVLVTGERRLAESILTEVGGGSCDYHLFINAGNELVTGIYKDYFEDLSDILNAEVDGAGKGTIKDKMRDADTWTSVYSKHGQGCYVLPYDSAFMGLVIDHQEFIDNEWYIFATSADAAKLAEQGITYTENDGKLVFASSTTANKYKAGDYILSAGKDGKYGTYDDGQPITLAEFDTMVNAIVDSDVSPFIWGGGVAEYLNHIFVALMAQYEGIEDYKTFYSYDSNGREVVLNDGTSEVITLENGYKVKSMEGLKVAYEFFEEYFDYTSGNSEYAHAQSKNTNASQYDGQNSFLLGHKGSSRNPNSAMLIDGIWWENEATSMFKSLEKENYGKGDREYRFLLLPNLPNQTSEKTVFACTESGSISIPKDSNATRLSYTKEFVKYILRNESLKMITKTTGMLMSYNYEIPADELKETTPFVRNIWDIYADSENIEIISPKVDNFLSPLGYASNRGNMTLFFPKVNNVFPMDCLSAAKNYSLSTIIKGLNDCYTKAIWDSYIQEARDNGFLGE